MKKYILQLTLLFTVSVFSQEKCYVQGITQDVFKKQETKTVVKPSYKVFTKTPAEYKKVEQLVLVQQGYKKKVLVPEVWGNKTVYYTKKDASNIIYTKDASFKDSLQKVIIHPAKLEWEQVNKEWVYQKKESESISVATIVADNKASYTQNLIPKTVSVYNVKHLVEPAKIQEVDVPAVYDTIVKYVLVKDASIEEKIIPAVYKKHTESVLVEKGGVLFLKEVACSLLQEQELHIEWDLKSAILIDEAKGIIEKEMMPFIKQNTNVKLMISSHTDDRGPEDLNISLSERRALAIVNHLVSKGIDASLLEAKGYGKSKPKIKCLETECTEDQRSENRRITYSLVAFTPKK